MTDQEFVHFLQAMCPRLGLRWAGFRTVRGTVRRRVTRRLRELELPDLDAYREYLERTPGEWQRLQAMCRIPISRFFRDREVFRLLGESLLPTCAEAALKAGRGEIRCLCAGCASGEEPYSVNLVWLTCLARRYPGLQLEIVAFDADEIMLKRALAGRYKASSLKELPDGIREKAFEPVDGEFRLRSTYRAGVRFEHCDIRDTMPSGAFDIVMCRNLVFTYFSDVVQRDLSERFVSQLSDPGFLIIGGHEQLPREDGWYCRLWPHMPIFQKAGALEHGGGATED